jgi:hypothetical protein
VYTTRTPFWDASAHDQSLLLTPGEPCAYTLCRVINGVIVAIIPKITTNSPVFIIIDLNFITKTVSIVPIICYQDHSRGLTR